MVGAEVGNAVGEGLGALFEFGQRPGVVDHADALGFLAGDAFAGVVELLGFAHADDERPDDTGATGTEAAKAGMAKLSVISGDNEVGHHGEFTATSDGVAVDAGDGDLRHVPEVHVDIGYLLHAGADTHHEAAAVFGPVLVAADDGVGAATGGRQVVAGAKRATCTPEDDDAGAVVGFEVVKGLVELVEKLLAQRVHLFRTVEGDAGDAAVGTDAVDFEGFEGLGHVFYLSGR